MSGACIRFWGSNLSRSSNFEPGGTLHINLKSPIPNLKPKIGHFWAYKLRFPGRAREQGKLNLFILSFSILDGGFFLGENVFWRMLSAFFLINRVRQLQFAPVGAMMFLQGFIFGSTVRSIGVPPDLNLYTL